MKLIEHFKDLSLNPNNAEELKGLILQLAVQGKLTAYWRANNLNIEPASELLKRIEAEKQQLIAEMKIKKEKPLSPLEEDEMHYELPKSWVWCRLIDISSINGGFAFKSSNYVDEGARVIRISDFDEKGFKNHKVVRHTYTDDLFQYILEDRNILIAMTGGTVGKSLFVNHVNETMVVNQRVATIKIIQPIFEAYVNCVIPTKLIQDVIEEAKNSTNDNISMSDIKGFNIPLPPLEEQKAIVEVVNTLFKEVEQLESLTKERIQLKESFVVSALNRLIEVENTQEEWSFLQQHFSSFFTEKKNIKSLRETILQLAIQGKLTKTWRKNNPNTESASELLKRIEAEKQQLIVEKKIRKDKPLPAIEEDEIPYELPEGWKFSRLGFIIKISSGDGLTSRNMDKEGSIPVYGGNGITGYHSKFNVTKAEIVIGRVGYYCGSIHLTEEKAWVTDNAFVTKFSEQNIYRDYLVWLLKGTNLRENDNATAQPVISGKKVYPIVVGLPPLKEQKEIVEKVHSLMSLCDELEKQIEISEDQIEQLMQSCLKEVFESNYKIEKNGISS